MVLDLPFLNETLKKSKFLSNMVFGDWVEDQVIYVQPTLLSEETMLPDSAIFLESDGSEYYYQIKLRKNDNEFNLRLYANTDPNQSSGLVKFDFFDTAVITFSAVDGLPLVALPRLSNLMYSLYLEDGEFDDIPEYKNIATKATQFYVILDEAQVRIESPLPSDSEPRKLYLEITDFFYSNKDIKDAFDFKVKEPVLPPPHILDQQPTLGESGFAEVRKDLAEHSKTLERLLEEIKENQATPLCKYYSIYLHENSIISEYYTFANHIPGISSCSHPKVLGNNPKLSPVCNWGKHSECSLFDAKTETVTKVSITPKNSTESKEFSVTNVTLMNRSKVFHINNITDDLILNTIEVPSNVSMDEAKDTSISILNEYIECYTEHEKLTDDVIQTIKNKKKSFISTLIGG